MTSPPGKKGEAQGRGRRVAARRSFYSRALDEAEELDFQLAHGVEGIDDEIALLRVKIKDLLENDPDNIRLLMQATNTLARLVRTRYKISSDHKKALGNAIGSVLQGLAIPLGIKYLP